MATFSPLNKALGINHHLHLVDLYVQLVIFHLKQTTQHSIQPEKKNYLSKMYPCLAKYLVTTTARPCFIYSHLRSTESVLNL